MGTPQSPNKKGRSCSSTINYLEYKYKENISISMTIIPYYNHYKSLSIKYEILLVNSGVISSFK